MLGELRQGLDSHGFADKELIAVGDGSFCNKTTFRLPLDRTILISQLPKICGPVFPIRGRVVAIMEQSSSVPSRSIKTPLSRGKRPKSFTAPNTAGSASRKSANCSGNGEAVGFCASSSWRRSRIASPRQLHRFRRSNSRDQAGERTFNGAPLAYSGVKRVRY
jgi:hypothetical protein